MRLSRLSTATITTSTNSTKENLCKINLTEQCWDRTGNLAFMSQCVYLTSNLTNPTGASVALCALRRVHLQFKAYPFVWLRRLKLSF